VGCRFEWDHGVTILEATTVFADPLSLLMRDPDHSDEEERYLVLGMSLGGRLPVVASVDRPTRTRLISARGASRSERRKYEEEA